MSMTLASTILFAVTVMNVEADSLPYYNPPSPWWPSYSYAFKEGSPILREQGEKLLLMTRKTLPWDSERNRAREWKVSKGA